MKYLSLSALVIGVAGLMSCSGSQQAKAAPPEVRIQQIPAADAQKYLGMRDLKNWRNPYLIIRPEGVALLDVANHEEHILKPEELPEALANLPASAWPYGRIVVVSDPGVGSANDLVPTRKNRGIVAGTLESMHILINWVPPG
ncbi:MAG: hypothetical protein WB952_04390 [Terriglobales bacterium]